MNRIFQQTYHVPGTLSADLAIAFTAPCDCTLLHVSAVGSNANDGKITIGDSSDADEFLTSSAIGDSGTPAEFDGDDFVDTAGNTHNCYYPRIADGTIVKIALDYDGASGTATYGEFEAVGAVKAQNRCLGRG
jgi:hypothetical protein